jgi:molybdenum cofactor biosynthesis enzyme
VKAVDKEMVIGDIYLVEKRGGRSGTYRRAGRACKAGG